MLKNKAFGRRFFSGLLAIILAAAQLPTIVLADKQAKADDFPVTKDVTSLMTMVEMEGVSQGADGKYYVEANKPYKFKLTVSEKDSLEMDMSDAIYFVLPEGVVGDNENGTINIGVAVDGYSKAIYHSYTVRGNIVTITWNKENPNFEDLARAHHVSFAFNLQARFDGTKDEVKFGTGIDVTIEVDNTGAVTVNKNVSGLKNDVVMTDEQKRAMTFELRNAAGEAVRAFTYADMSDGSVTFAGLKPGTYTVVETSHPDFPNYSFDTGDSVTVKEGTLGVGGVLTLGLSNDYEYHKGSLELNKTIDCLNWDNTTDVPDSVKNNISFTITGPYGYRRTVSYGDFTDGKFTLTGLDVGEYTVTETNKVSGYTWTYTVNNAAKDTPSASVEIEKDETASVSFENTYVQQTANLTIKKTASGAAVPANTQFKVSFPDGSYKTFKYSDMNDGEYTFSDVPLGTYKVEEIRDTALVANYSLTVSGEGNVTLTTADETKTGTINNSYTPLGAIKLEKEIAGDLSGDDLSDAQKSAMVFSIYNSQNNCVGTLSYADILAGNNTISDLPVGSYTVKETGHAISGYSVETVPANREMSVDVALGQTSTASFSNTYTKDEYKLSVDKVFGAGSAYNADNLPEKFISGTRFTVTKGGKTVASCTYEELAETLNGLILDGAGPYVITETNPDVDGVDIVTMVSRDGGESYSVGKRVEVTLTNHVPANIVFKNVYTIQGAIAVDKTVEGLPEYDEEELRSKITYSVYREVNGTYTLYLENVSLDVLEAGILVPVGNYYVQETGTLGVHGYNGPDVTVQVGAGDEKADSRSENFAVAESSTVIVYFTNTYTTGDNRAYIQLEKYVGGLAMFPNSEETILSDSLNVNNTNGDRLYDGIRLKLEENLDGVWHEVGTYPLSEFLNGGVSVRCGHYRLTELYADVAGHSLSVEYLIKNEGDEIIAQNSATQIEFDIEENEILKAEVHNVYTPLGNLEITKTIAGGIVMEGDDKKTVVFNVSGPFNFSNTFTLADIYNAQTGEYKKTFTNIPVGEYTVSETAGDTAEYTLVVSGMPAGGKVTVPFGETAEVDITNTYTRRLGNIIVEKTLAGDVPSELTAEEMKAMLFTVRDSSGQTIASASYDMFTEGKYTFEDLPTGTYTVTETISDVLADKYSVEITNNNQTVSVSDSSDAKVSLGNTFHQTGNLKLVKNFAGCEIPDNLKATVQFKYWMVDEDGNKVGEERSVAYSEFTNGSYTVKNLTPGRYVVSEMDDTTGYVRSTSVTVNGETAEGVTDGETDVVFGETSTVAFTNTYSEISSLKITKTIDGDLKSSMSDEQKKAISFTVTDSQGNPVCESFSYYDMADGVMTIKNLQPGTYTITEKISDPSEQLFGDYSRVTTYQVGSAAAVKGTTAEVAVVHGDNAVTFTNTYSAIAPLSVIKSSSNTYVGLVSKDGVKYPVWKFTLNISNLNPLTTRNGTTSFTEIFDDTHADWFRLATEEEVQALGVGENAGIRSLVEGKAAPSASFGGDDNVIVISGITEETADKCEFSYYLIVKDRDVLRALNSSGDGTTNGVSYDFNNTVSYHPLPHKAEVATTDASYRYSFTAVEKGIINLDDEGNLYEIIDGQIVRVNYAKYSVVLNPDGAYIGDQPTIIATDVFSENQTVLLSSVVTEPTEGVSFQVDNDAHKIIFTIPNGTPVKVSYRVAISESQEETVVLTNEITLLGFTVGINRPVSSFAAGAGQGEIYSMNLIKVDALDNSRKLEGVRFSLYDGADNELLTTETTNKDGAILFKYWGENGAFRLDYDYYLLEESTIDGYNMNSDKIWIRISKTETPGLDENGVHVLRSGGELVVSNDPVVATLGLSKNFNDWSKQSTFSFKLEALDGAPMPTIGEDVFVATESQPSGNFGTIRFDVSDSDLEGDKVVTYQYTIQEIVNPEDMVDGIYYDTAKHTATVVISDSDHDGVKEVAVSYDNNQRSLTITNIYETVDISGEKTWDDAENQDGIRPDEITIHLLKNDEVIATETITADDGWSWEFTDLPKYESGTEVVYSIEEDEVEGYTTAYDGYNVINSYEPSKVSLEVKKVWRDSDNFDRIRPKEIKVMLLADGEETGEILVLNSDGEWSGAFAELDEYKAGTKIVYTVKEINVPAGYTAVVSGTAEEGFVITNSHVPSFPDIPGTGDSNNTFGWLGVMLFGIAGFMATYSYKKRNEAE